MALYYPQMPAGSVVQFPYRRRNRARTVVSELADGTAWKQFDDLAQSTEWALRYANLSEAEMALLHEFFGECEGRLKSFTFFDPAGNLLLWSEDFAATPWQRSGALTVSGGVQDPFGGTGANRLTNAGGAAQIFQAAGIPGRYETCFSLYLRSEAPVTLRVFKRCGTESRECAVLTGPVWKRVSVRGAFAGSGTTQECGIEVPVGAVVDVCGAQLEAQPGMSAYRKSAGQGGIYTRARFATDSLVTVAEAPGLYSVNLRIFAF